MKDKGRFYRSLYKIRRVEEEVARVYPTDKVKSPVHLSIGQEAVSVGVCEALKSEDIVFGTYRGHAAYLAKGGDLKKMIAELYGKVTGCAKGKGGSMHLVDVSAGVMGGSAVVATTIPQAVGYALALKYQGSKKVVVSFFGDGAVEEGVFHESLNFASLKKLPIIFICENNNLAIHSHKSIRQSYKSIAKLASVYNIPSKTLNNDDVFKIYEQAKYMVEKIKKTGTGPYFLEIQTYRYKEHVGPGDDFKVGYRSETEAKRWMAKDQVKQVGKMLDLKSRGKIEAEVEKEIKDAFQFAEDSPYPADQELYTDVYQES